MFALATDEDCERARRDDQFRRQLVKEHLEKLLDGLSTLRKGSRARNRRATSRSARSVELRQQRAALLQK